MRTNWAGNITFHAARHSFNDVAGTPGELICLAAFEQQPNIDLDRNQITVSAGSTYGEVGQLLHERGYALANMASLPHVTIAGACATATHGSGDDRGNLATAISALEFVAANGDVVSISREHDADKLCGLAVGLGGFGAITSVTLDVVPAFSMQQEIYAGIAFPDLYANFEEIMASAYSVCLFTDWCHGQIDHLRIKHALTDDRAINVPSEFFGAKHTPLAQVDGEENDDWLARPTGSPGPSYVHLPHFELINPTAPGYELQTEYCVSRQQAVDAFRAIEAIHGEFASLITLTEIRSVAADELWMSPSYQTATVGIHFGWKRDWQAVKRLLPLLENALAPFDARPHWGKLFTMSRSRLESLYKRLPDFRALLRQYDPQGKFRNSFLDTHLFDSV